MCSSAATRLAHRPYRAAPGIAAILLQICAFAISGGDQGDEPGRRLLCANSRSLPNNLRK